jgi:hypothetical protein
MEKVVCFFAQYGEQGADGTDQQGAQPEGQAYPPGLQGE